MPHRTCTELDQDLHNYAEGRHLWRPFYFSLPVVYSICDNLNVTAFMLFYRDVRKIVWGIFRRFNGRSHRLALFASIDTFGRCDSSGY